MAEFEGSIAPGGDEGAAGSLRAETAARPVFISYASPDLPIAEEIVAHLEAAGVRCWIAPRDVMPGSLYAEEIIRAINEATLVVLVLSAHAVASKHVGKEIERASSKARPVVTFRIDSKPLTAGLEYFLSESQWIDAVHDRKAALSSLLVAMRKHTATLTDASAPPARSEDRYRTRRVGWVVASLVVVGVVIGWWVSNKSAPLAPVDATPTAVVAGDKSVAVLPFVDMSEKKDQEYFSDGLSEELIDRLTKVADLRVPARTSSFYYKGKQTTLAEIAKSLGVANVLEGSVRKSGNNLRITAQLVRVDTGYHIWSRTFDRPLDNIFKMQDEIAGAVVEALEVSLGNGSSQLSPGTQNVAAYNSYLQASYTDRTANSHEDREKALAYADSALSQDPEYAAAWVIKSEALDDLGRSREARDAASQAIKYGPNESNSYAAMARVLLSTIDIEAIAAQLQRALALESNNPWALAMMGHLDAYRGNFDQSVAKVERARARDPMNPSRTRDLAQAYYFAGRYTEAISLLGPNIPSKHFMASQILLAQNDAVAALAELDQETDGDIRFGCGCRVLMYDALGDTAKANETLATLENTKAREEPYGIGRVYADRGDIDQAFKWFERAVRENDGDLLMLKIDPLLKNVRNDPRYSALLKTLKLE